MLDGALQDVHVGGEVQVVAHHAAPPRAGFERRHGELVEVHRGRIGEDHFILAGPDEPADLGADPLRRGEPALVPGADQPPAPLLLDGVAQPRHRPPRQPAERITVEIDELRVLNDELVSVGRQLILAVQLEGVRRVGAHGLSLRAAQRWSTRLKRRTK